VELAPRHQVACHFPENLDVPPPVPDAPLGDVVPDDAPTAGTPAPADDTAYDNGSTERP
jgi:peptide/nickel transport system ATP-binding protein/oligopeptide transport system ATP-binding protein